MARALSRKEFLALGGAASAASVLSACDLSPTKSRRSGAAEGGEGAKGREAPSLAKRVQSGELPAVADRLPEKPLVIEPIDGIGRYGGVWRTVLTSKDTTWLWTTVNYGEHLVHWDPDWKKVVPHVVESVDIQQDGAVYVLALRKGMKWSDGEPFTADDILFWRDAVLANKELTPAVNPNLGDDGRPFAAEKLDDYQLKITFEQPHGLFLQYLAAKTPYMRLIPRHYMEKYHKDYNPDVESLARKAKVDSWSELFLQKMDALNNVELPRLSAWVAQNPWSDGRRMTWVRNPYYFCVDPDGSQLPYLDEVVFTFFSDPQPMLLAAAHGDVDMYMRKDDTIPKYKPVLARSAEAGHYKLVDVKSGDHNTMGICFNLTHKDPVKREIFQNKEFRIGLSYAINRQQIIDLVYQRQGEPAQTSPLPEAPFFDDAAEEMATQYLDFDLDEAGSHLDRAGYSARDGQGRRLGPDGKPISFAVLTQTRYTFMADAFELIQRSWAKVGVEVHINNVDSSLVGDRIDANDFDCTVDAGELGYLGMIGDPRWLFATGGSSYAPLWSNWFEGATPSEEPPPAMKQQIQIWRNEVFTRSALEDQFPGMRKIVAIAKDQFWTIGIGRPQGLYAIVGDNFRNVPGADKMWIATGCPYPGVSNPCQFYVEA